MSSAGSVRDSTICGPLALRFTPLMTVRTRSPGCVAFGARLFLARQHRLDAADFDDDVAVLEALDRAVHDLADPLVVLGEDVLALGLADLLEDDLLGGLRGDAAEHFGRLRELHLVAELDAVGHFVAVERPVHLARFVERDLGGRRRSRPRRRS